MKKRTVYNIFARGSLLPFFAAASSIAFVVTNSENEFVETAVAIVALVASIAFTSVRSLLACSSIFSTDDVDMAVFGLALLLLSPPKRFSNNLLEIFQLRCLEHGS